MAASKKIKALVDSVVDKQALRDLKRNPAEFGKRFKLSPKEMKAIKSADLMITARFGNPLLGKTVGVPGHGEAGTITTNTITITPGTVTGDIPVGEGSGMVNPLTLEDLSKAQLIALATAVLKDANYAKSVRDFLGLR